MADDDDFGDLDFDDGGGDVDGGDETGAAAAAVLCTLLTSGVNMRFFDTVDEAVRQAERSRCENTCCIGAHSICYRDRYGELVVYPVDDPAAVARLRANSERRGRERVAAERRAADRQEFAERRRVGIDGGPKPERPTRCARGHRFDENNPPIYRHHPENGKEIRCRRCHLEGVRRGRAKLTEDTDGAE